MKKKTIFIVDDDRFYTKILEAKLSELGTFKIQKYYNGQDCINNAYQQPDIIFLDHYLGDTDGFEVLKDVKSTYPSIHIVMLSGQREMKVAIKSLRFGATDYLIKDIDDCQKKLSTTINVCDKISKSRATNTQQFKSRLFNFLFTF